MARMRYVKPEYWTDSKIIRLGPWARLLYIGSWNFAICEVGHLDDDAMALKLKVLPADPIDADEVLEEIVATGRIRRKALPDGRTYLVIPRLPNHQKTETRWGTRCPYCAAEAAESTPSDPVDVPPIPSDLSEPLQTSEEVSDALPISLQEGIGGEGIGGDNPPTGGPGGDASQQAAPPKKSSEQRGARLPEGWMPSDKTKGRLRGQYERPDSWWWNQHERFTNHWLSKAGREARKVNWDLTWSNWMHEAVSREANRPAFGRQGEAPKHDDRAAPEDVPPPLFDPFADSRRGACA